MTSGTGDGPSIGSGGGPEGSGSGLGLAIVKRLVVADGGEVELLPAAGGGIDAVVRLEVLLLSSRPIPGPTTVQAADRSRALNQRRNQNG